MKTRFLKKFSKDLDRISKSKDREAVLAAINLVKSASNWKEVSGTKKLQGFTSAYRIRSGDYRIGVFVEDDVVEFARVAHRKDIYRIFP